MIFKNISYCTQGHPRQVLDLYLPKSKDKFPLIIWIHGGAFMGGSKQDHVPLDYLERRYAVASINYRLSQHALFPAQIEDCKSAVRWLRTHAEKYQLDAERFAAWGESAGGHLAAMLGVSGHVTAFEVGDHLDVSSRVQAVVDYFGPTDFPRVCCMIRKIRLSQSWWAALFKRIRKRLPQPTPSPMSDRMPLRS
jgi:acetyl esterase/lipase